MGSAPDSVKRLVDRFDLSACGFAQAGKVTRLTPGHQAKVEEKPEVIKTGGTSQSKTAIRSTLP
jgi:hypothetical protein